MEEADFSGWATKANLLCKDGRTIMPGAFKGQDKQRIPLVWMHGHDKPENVLGHAVLEERPEGVYAYCYFNNTPSAQHMKASVQHEDVNQLSIWANELIQRGTQVIHGRIKEVSLVLAGANPGANIEQVTIAHSDGFQEISESDGILYTGEHLEHSGSNDDEYEYISHEDVEDDEDETLEEVLDSMSEKQKEALYFVVGSAIKSTEEELKVKETVKHSDIDQSHTDTQAEKGAQTMFKDIEHQNVFDKTDTQAQTGHVLSHADKKGIFADAMRTGSMQEAVKNFCLSHGIEQIDILFPEAQSVNGDVPEFLKRRTEWVQSFMSQTTKTPFSRIKNLWADLTESEARAKGYITASLKKEEFFNVAKRVTTPTTVYKKQKLDRDDVVDITDFDVVAWLKLEMRVMLDEEIARAALIGDGRDVTSPDKINEACIRPVTGEHELFVTHINVNLDDSGSSINEFIDAAVSARAKYRGTGIPTMYTTESVISAFLLLKDGLGRDLYRSVDEVAQKLRVREIVPVEAMEDASDVIAVMLNPIDYTFGANKGGEVTLFDQFDIDFNQEKYLIETRCCGALVKLKSALVFNKVAGASVLLVPQAPAFDAEENEVTIPNQTHVKFYNKDTEVEITNTVVSLAPNQVLRVTAVAQSGYYFATSDENEWSFRGVAS